VHATTQLSNTMAARRDISIMRLLWRSASAASSTMPDFRVGIRQRALNGLAGHEGCFCCVGVRSDFPYGVEEFPTVRIEQEI